MKYADRRLNVNLAVALEKLAMTWKYKYDYFYENIYIYLSRGMNFKYVNILDSLKAYFH